MRSTSDDEPKYIAKFIRPAKTSAVTIPPCPPKAPPRATKREVRPAIRTNTFTLFMSLLRRDECAKGEPFARPRPAHRVSTANADSLCEGLALSSTPTRPNRAPGTTRRRRSPDDPAARRWRRVATPPLRHEI